MFIVRWCVLSFTYVCTSHVTIKAEQARGNVELYNLLSLPSLIVIPGRGRTSNNLVLRLFHRAVQDDKASYLRPVFKEMVPLSS
jgi:hypothetical protein